MLKKRLAVFLVLVLVVLSSSCKNAKDAFSENTTNRSDISVSRDPQQRETTPTSTPTPFALPENVNFAVEPVFDDAEPFNAFGYAVVGIATNGQMRYGMINEAGEFVIEPEYESYCIPDWMKITHPEIDIGYTWLQKDGLWGFVNEKCEWVTECKYDDCLHFTNIGFAGVKADGKWGFISTSGEMVVEPQYDLVEMCFGNGFAKICENGRWGLCDSEGNVILEPTVSHMLTDGDCSDFGYWSSGGHDIVLIDEGSGLLSFDGEVLVENAKHGIYSIGSNGLVFVDSPTDGTGYFNIKGELVIPLQENEQGYTFADNGLAIVETWAEDDSKFYRYINQSGENVFKTEFENAYNFAPNGLASVVNGGVVGYIDRTGAYVIEPQFDTSWCMCFDANGFTAVLKDGKWAIIDDKGRLMTDYIYDDCERIINREVSISVFAMSRDGKWGLVNASGETILEHQFDHIIFSAPNSMEGWNIINYTDADLAMTQKDGKYGIISLHGEILLEANNEDYLIVSENGYSVFVINGKYGYVDVVQN